MNRRRVFGIAGWLLADLMIVFLIIAASAGGTIDNGGTKELVATPPTVTTTTQLPDTGPLPDAGGSASCGGLELPIREFDIAIPDPPDPAAIAAAVASELRRLGITGKPVGLVEAFGRGGADVGRGVDLAKSANDALRGAPELAALPRELQFDYFTGGEPIGTVQFKWVLARVC